MSEFIKEIIELNEDKVLQILENNFSKNVSPMKIMDEVKVAMKQIGEKFQNKEYFLPDLIMSGEILRKVFERIGPKLKKAENENNKKGKIILGTVAGDIHDIGKDIVKFMLDINDFNILDLGVDVPSEIFIKNMKEFKPNILALSGFLTITFDSMKEIIQKINDEGLRNSVKIMIGGGTIDERVLNYVGADAYGESAMDAVKIAKKWIECD